MVPSPVSSELRPMVTFAVGSLSKTMVNVAVTPASVVFPLIADTVIPAISSSLLITTTSLAFIPV